MTHPPHWIRAAICREFGAPLSLERLRLDSPVAGEVRVKIKAAAICHSDIIYMDGGWGGKLPTVFGHEAAGVVTEVGKTGVIPDDLYPGAEVIVTLLRTCGHCAHCERGRASLCDGLFDIDEHPRGHDENGAPVFAGLRTGAFAEEVVIHASQVMPLPQGMTAEIACLLSCGVLTGVGAVFNTAQLPADARTAVIGCGGVGLNCVQAASLAGAAPLVAIDLRDNKLQWAERLGADETINPSAVNLHEAARAVSETGFDYIFMAAASTQAVETALPLLAKGGTLVLAGMAASGEFAHIDATDIANDGKRIIGSKMGDSVLRADIPKIAAFYRAGKLQLDALIGGRYPFAQINDAIAAAKTGDTLRNLLLFD